MGWIFDVPDVVYGEPVYQRILQRLRAAHAEAVMQETRDVLCGGQAEHGPAPSRRYFCLFTDEAQVLCTHPACQAEHLAPADLLRDEPRGFEWARGVLAGPARVGADARPTRQLEELSADLDAAHAVPVIACGVVGHAPDCECATL